MVALGIRYLNQFIVAAEPGSRETPEWPLHPGRVFLALAAAHFQTGSDPAERKALLWLEGLEQAPMIHACEAVERRASNGGAVTRYVPINDKAGPAKALLQSAPLTRDRQPRTFAQAWLEDDTVYLVWLDAEVSEVHRRALEGLCKKVSRIGHSSSLVHVWVAMPEEIGEATWVPDDGFGEIRLRLPGPGTLEDLERCYNKAAVDGYGELLVEAEEADGRVRAAARKRLMQEFGAVPPARLRPVLSLYQGYARPAEQGDEASIAGTVFSPHLIVRSLEQAGGPYHHLDLACVLVLSERWREALLSQSNDLSEKARELISGHDAAGAPLRGPHLAFLPLAFVGHPHADGRLLGMGLALPNEIEPTVRRDVLRALARVKRVALGRLGAVRVGTVTASRPSWNLQSAAWTAHPAGATHWSTVAPIAFDRHPKTGNRSAYQREVGAMVAAACRHVGLPAPETVTVTPVSIHLGAPPAHDFPKFRRKDNSQRRHAHAIIVFDQPVRGPILLGAGRYRGYGFCRPVLNPDGENR